MTNIKDSDVRPRQEEGCRGEVEAERSTKLILGRRRCAVKGGLQWVQPTRGRESLQEEGSGSPPCPAPVVGGGRGPSPAPAAAVKPGGVGLP